MAVRNPTSYTQWIDEDIIKSGKDILAAEPGYVLNDQIFALDQTVLVLSWYGGYHVNSAAGTTVTRNYFYVRNKDMCDVAGVTNNEIECNLYVRCGVSNPGIPTTDGAIITTSTAVANNTSTVAVSSVAGDSGAHLWRLGDTINIKTNGIEDTLQIDIQCINNASALEGFGVYFDGLCLVAKET